MYSWWRKRQFEKSVPRIKLKEKLKKMGSVFTNTFKGSENGTFHS